MKTAYFLVIAASILYCFSPSESIGQTQPRLRNVFFSSADPMHRSMLNLAQPLSIKELVRAAYDEHRGTTVYNFENFGMQKNSSVIRPGFLRTIGSHIIKLQLLFDNLPLKNIEVFSYTADVTVTTTRIVITIHF